MTLKEKASMALLFGRVYTEVAAQKARALTQSATEQASKAIEDLRKHPDVVNMLLDAAMLASLVVDVADGFRRSMTPTKRDVGKDEDSSSEKPDPGSPQHQDD